MHNNNDIPQRASHRSALIAAFSTVVEWYDFTLYIYFSTVLSRVFFGPGEASLLKTLATFAIAYFMRPIGAVFFGYIGDRHGRRPMLLISVAVMTATMLAIACMPTRAQIGPAAGWFMLLSRCIMGFAVGGEYTGVVAYLMESAPSGRRGFITSLAAAASEVGGLLAVGASALTVSLLSGAKLDAWGWRLPFLFGAALAGCVWIARSTLQESPDFEQQRTAGTVPQNPLAHTITNFPIGIFRAFAISALGSITYYVGISYVPTFLISTSGLSEGRSLWLSTIAAVMVIVITPMTGILSDRVGRKPVLIFLCGCSAILPVTMFSLMAGGSHVEALFGAIVLAIVAGGVSAVGAVSTAEQFQGEGRLSGLALGATSATTIFGGLTPYVAQLLIKYFGLPTIPGIMIAVVALFVLPVLVMMPEPYAGLHSSRRK